MNSDNVIYDHCPEEQDKEYQPNATASKVERVVKVWKWGQQRLKQFWELWRSEYLLSLRERTQMYLKGSKRLAHNSPQVGYVVLIKWKLPHGKWRVGAIHELVRGKDQMIRLARVLASPNKYLHRALNLLYPIECPRNKSIHSDQNRPEERSPSNEINVDTPGDNDQEDNNKRSSDFNDEEVDEQEGDAEADDDSGAVAKGVDGRAVRKAAVIAKEKIKEWVNPTENFVWGVSRSLRVTSYLFNI